MDWHLHPERAADADDNDLRDTATSPLKQGDTHMTQAETNAKKRLAFEEETHNEEKQLSLANATHGAPQSVMAMENPTVEVTKEKKRIKRSDGTMVSGASSGSAASLEDDRHTQ